MKKLLSVLAIAFAMVTGLFAENVVTISGALPILEAGENTILESYAGDFRITTYYADIFGMSSSFNIGIPAKLVNTKTQASATAKELGLDVFLMGATVGVAIRPVETANFSVVIIPELGVNILMGSSMIVYMGPSAELAASYKFTDSFHITAGCQFDYYLYGFSDSGSSTDIKMFNIVPKVGISLAF